MRLLIDTLIALMLVAILAAVLWQYRSDSRQGEQVQELHQSLARLQEQMLYRGALGETPTSPAGFPLEVSPTWFPEGLPFNNLVPGRQPWIDVAAADDPSEEPPDPILRRPDQAGFWYNPNRGIFRARVPPHFTRRATLELYNSANGTGLSSLEERTPASAASPGSAMPQAVSADPAAIDSQGPHPPPAAPAKLPTLRDQD